MVCFAKEQKKMIGCHQFFEENNLMVSEYFITLAFES